MKTKILYTSLLFISILLLNSCCDCDDDNCTEQTWYQDLDQDGFGNSNVSQISCTQPDDYVLDNTDCNDDDENVKPGAVEDTSNGIDDDCNGEVDECYTNEDCNGVCLYSTCHEICVNDGDCPTGTTCVDIGGGVKVCL